MTKEEKNRSRTQVLVEALPYIKKFYGKTIVIKYGGHAMTDPVIRERVISDIVLMRFVGMNPIIVHGGGPDINYWLAREGHESTFVDGLRVTDATTMTVAQMVLVGKINQEIVSLIHKKGGQGVGISGVDGRTIIASKKTHEKDGVAIDLGYVGHIDAVNPELINLAMGNGYIPVISPIGLGADGQAYNINGDTAAAAIAASVGAHKLFMLTDIRGVLDGGGKLLSTLTLEDMAHYIADGTINGGMIPKVRCCAQALRDGIDMVHIIDGTADHSLLLELFTDDGIGTMVVKE